jgi:hypothetical protein
MATNTNDTSNAPDWRQLCQVAFFELDPEKLLQRIAEARDAVLDRIEDCHSRSADREGSALRKALEALNTLQKIAQRDIGVQKKTGT